MNIIKRELKANFKSFLFWIFPLSMIMMAASFEFEYFAGDPAIVEAMENFEQLFLALGSTVTNMTTPEGFVSVFSIYIYLPLAIFSGLLGSTIISKEEKNKTAEYLFTLPVKRWKVIMSKFIVAVIYTLLINLVVISVVYISFLKYEVSSSFTSFMTNMSLGVFLTQIVFLGIGMVLSSILKQYKKSGSITIGILMSTFMVSILIGMVDGKLDFIKFAIPFQYFPAPDMLAGDFNLPFIILSISIFIVTVCSTFFFYRKRDLYI